MRNYLVFPDGTKQSFMYPEDRDITVGEEILVTMFDDSVQFMKVSRIEKKEKEILFYLSF